jgi:hypothetical protein
MFWIVLTAPDETLKFVELNEATPVVAVVALATDIAPVAEIVTGAVPDTATVPPASGKVIVLAAVGLVKFRVIELAPLLPRMNDVPI